MKKIALIIPNNLWVCPYLSIYTRIFDEVGVEYEIISWNREDRRELGIQFVHREKSRRKMAILWAYIKYAIFLKKIIKRNGYEKLVVFTPQIGIFLSSFLKKRYKGRYIFDYRDLSIEQKPIFAKRFRVLLANSYANVISSPGFKKYLPTGFNYLISHNFNTDLVRKAMSAGTLPDEAEETKVLTIGALRKDMNLELMDALGNKVGFTMSFVGKGLSADYLKNYAKSKGYHNVIFTGFYKKEEEPKIYNNYSFVNIVYPLIPSHISALSNRFYNSLIFKRPMIVTRNTIQGDYAEKYGVGMVIDNCDELDKKIINYKKTLNYKKYEQNCNILLAVFLEEYTLFERVIKDFVRREDCNSFF